MLTAFFKTSSSVKEKTNTVTLAWGDLCLWISAGRHKFADGILLEQLSPVCITHTWWRWALAQMSSFTLTAIKLIANAGWPTRINNTTVSSWNLLVFCWLGSLLILLKKCVVLLQSFNDTLARVSFSSYSFCCCCLFLLLFFGGQLCLWISLWIRDFALFYKALCCFCLFVSQPWSVSHLCSCFPLCPALFHPLHYPLQTQLIFWWDFVRLLKITNIVMAEMCAVHPVITILDYLLTVLMY